jgi:hypothetical protein
MRTQIRDLVASALHQVKAHTLPAVCERYGLDPGDGSEAFNSKVQYVMRRLMKLSDARVLAIAKEVIADYPDDRLQSAIEQLDQSGGLISDITRHSLSEALNGHALGGKRDLFELLRKHFSEIDSIASYRAFGDTLADDIYQHAVRNNDWDSADILERVGFLTCSQARLFHFLEDVLHPVRRDEGEQENLTAILNPILRRDGYCLVAAGKISGYPFYRVQTAAATGVQPADELISKTLSSFDESGVHASWQKALERRTADPEGAITAAKTLLDSVCKHIIEESGASYGENDDLPKLYAIAADCLRLAPSQHTETVFKAILGNCQAVVGQLAAIRNKLGDSHGQGKRQVKPLPRHAELAVNLAGSAAMFLVATFNARAAEKPKVAEHS